MSRIDPCLQNLSESGRKAVIPYLVGGDGCGRTPAEAAASTVAAMHAMVENGADMIELGYPFSDPMAEGPVIQRAHQRALAAGINLSLVLKMVADFRSRDSLTPVVLMGYANPVCSFGLEVFAGAAKAAGVDGLLVVDIDQSEQQAWVSLLSRYDIDMIFLISPTTSEVRLRQIVKWARGYIYYVSLKGVTGAGSLNTGEVAQKLSRLRGITDKPVCVGFGIRSPEVAQQVAATADGIVVGSLLVEQLQQLLSEQCSAATVAATLGTAIAGFRQAVDTIQ